MGKKISLSSGGFVRSRRPKTSLSGQWHPPQTEHSGGPLGDPSARVFEVFLIVSQSTVHRGTAEIRFVMGPGAYGVYNCKNAKVP